MIDGSDREGLREPVLARASIAQKQICGCDSALCAPPLYSGVGVRVDQTSLRSCFFSSPPVFSSFLLLFFPVVLRLGVSSRAPGVSVVLRTPGGWDARPRQAFALNADEEDEGYSKQPHVSTELVRRFRVASKERGCFVGPSPARVLASSSSARYPACPATPPDVVHVVLGFWSEEPPPPEGKVTPRTYSIFSSYRWAHVPCRAV